MSGVDPVKPMPELQRVAVPVCHVSMYHPPLAGGFCVQYVDSDSALRCGLSVVAVLAICCCCAAGHSTPPVCNALRQYLEQEWMRKVNEHKHQHGKHHKQQHGAVEPEQTVPLKFDKDVSGVLVVLQLLFVATALIMVICI